MTPDQELRKLQRQVETCAYCRGMKFDDCEPCKKACRRARQLERIVNTQHTVTHIAGPRMVFDLDDGHQRVIQRCCVCGEKLVDNLGSAVAIMSNAGPETDKDYPSWPYMGLVQLSVDENPRREVLLKETDRIPKDTCLQLVADLVIKDYESKEKTMSDRTAFDPPVPKREEITKAALPTVTKTVPVLMVRDARAVERNKDGVVVKLELGLDETRAYHLNHAQVLDLMRSLMRE